MAPARRRAKVRPGVPQSFESLFGIARSLTANLYVGGLFKEIVNVVERLTGAEGASLLLLDEEGSHLYFQTATGEKSGSVQGQRVPLTQGLAGWVATRGKSVIVSDARKDPRFAVTVDRATGFSTRSLLAVPFLYQGRVIGVCEAINKKKGSFSTADRRAMEELAGLAAVSIENARRAESENNFFEHTLQILTAAIEAADPAYAGHPARAAELAGSLAEKMGLPAAAKEEIRLGALLHDIGLIALNHRALVEKVTPQAQARARDRLHPLLGVELLNDIHRLRRVVPIIRSHHECFDGTGHPDHLAGEAIPIGARILGLIEALEEVRFSGVAEPELSAMQIQLAQNGAGTKFDPRVVAAYLSLR